MVKVKIIKLSQYLTDSYYEEDINILFPMTLDWEEMTEQDYRKLVDAVNKANAKLNRYRYIVVSYSNDAEMKNEIFKLASDWQKEQDRKEAAYQKKLAEEKKKKEEKAAERRKKNLAKKMAEYERLKKEFENMQYSEPEDLK